MTLIDKEALLEKLSTFHPDYTFNITAFRNFVNAEPVIEQKKGKWIEKHHEYTDEGSVIDEWQSCKCSICGRYDTRPYLYYFDEPRFCSWCGAKMEESDG